MVIQMLTTRSPRLLVVALLAAGLIGSATDGLAQSAAAPPPGRGPRADDRPVQRTLPREAIYANLSKELDLKEAEAQALAQSVEGRGFPLRETVVLLLLAKARTDRLIEQGTVAKQQGAGEIQSSADFLVGLVDQDKVGWLALVERSEARVNLGALVTRASGIIGFYADRVGTSTEVPAVIQRKTE